MPSSPVMLDTNGLFALLNRQDRLHQAAVVVYEEIVQTKRTILLTDWIIAETGNGLARTPARQNVRAAVNLLLGDPRTILVVMDEQWTRQSLDRYEERSDKTWGLVDCATMLVMEEHNSIDVLTSDRHFEQAGLNALLRAKASTGE